MARKEEQTPLYWGPPPKPSEAGSMGRGGARERHDGCPYLGVRNRADFVTTMPAGTYRPAEVTLFRNGVRGKPTVSTRCATVLTEGGPGDSLVTF